MRVDMVGYRHGQGRSEETGVGGQLPWGHMMRKWIASEAAGPVEVALEVLARDGRGTVIWAPITAWLVGKLLRGPRGGDVGKDQPFAACALWDRVVLPGNTMVNSPLFMIVDALDMPTEYLIKSTQSFFYTSSFAKKKLRWAFLKWEKQERF